MNRTIRTALGVLCALSVELGPIVPASAQEGSVPVTLNEALVLFGQNSPELHLARSRLRASIGGIRQGRALPNPRLALTHEALGDHSESYLNLTQRLDFVWEAANRGARAEALRLMARAEFLADSIRLASEVRVAYLDAWRFRQSLDAYRQGGEVMEELVAAATARVAEGDLAGYDLRRLGLERLQYDRRTGIAELDLEEAERRLGSYLLDPRDYRRFSAQAPDLGEITVQTEEELVARALENRPEMRSAARLVEALEASAGLTRTSILNGTSVTGGLKRQADGQDGIFLGLELPLPIADRRRGATDAAQAEISAAESEMDLLRRAVVRQVLLASSKLHTAQRQQALLGPTGVDEAQEILSIARLSFAEGEMRAVDLLDAARAYIDARLLESQLQEDLLSSYFELERAVGGFSTEYDNGASER